MSRALSVYHGPFGRATLYELNRPMTTHAHREGHLTFYVGGGDARVTVAGTPHGADHALWGRDQPLGAACLHAERRHRGAASTSCSISTTPGSPAWDGSAELRFGRSDIAMTPRINARVSEVVSLLEDYDTSENFDGTLFELTDACFEQSLAASPAAGSAIADRRPRSSTSGCASRSC